MKKKLNVKKVIIDLLLCIAIVGLVFSSFKLYTIWNEYNKNKTSYEELRQYQPVITPDETNDTTFKFTKEDFDKLYAINNDLVGWINIPGTQVNYPIVQGTQSEYYLTHNFAKEENEGGAIFIDSELSKPFEEKNTILYGHHMRDGSMFGSLKEFESQQFLDENNKIYVATKDITYLYQIFSVYVDKPDSDSYYYRFETGDEYLTYLNKLKSKSIVNSDIEKFAMDDKIITLSTCSYEFNDARLIVHAKLIKTNKNS